MRKLFAVLFLLPTVAFAQQPQLIDLSQGGQYVLKLNAPFSSVAVADPEVVDALPRSDRVLILTGRKPGISDMVIFADGLELLHVRASVAPGSVAGKVLTHNKKNLTEYNAYQCNPVCARIEDKFESKAPEVVFLGAGGAPVATGGSVNVVVPPR